MGPTSEAKGPLCNFAYFSWRRRCDCLLGMMHKRSIGLFLFLITILLSNFIRCGRVNGTDLAFDPFDSVMNLDADAISRWHDSMARTGACYYPQQTFNAVQLEIQNFLRLFGHEDKVTAVDLGSGKPEYCSLHHEVVYLENLPFILLLCTIL